MFELVFAASAQRGGLVKQIKQSLGVLQRNPKHPSLHTHPYASIEQPYHPKEKVFEAYAQNNTPSAYRIFWCYGPHKRQLTILAITPHP